MRKIDLLWAALAIVVVSCGMTAWEMHLKTARPAHAVVFQSSPPAAVKSGPPAAPVVVAMAPGNGATLATVRPADDEDHSYLRISLSSKGEMLLQDPQGRRLGFDPESHQLVSQIQNGSYDEGDQIDDDEDDSPNAPGSQPTPTPRPTPPATLSGLDDNGFRNLELGQPAPGKYLLTVIARNETSYSLSVVFYNRLYNMSSADFDKVAFSPVGTHVYELEVPDDASGEIKVVRREVEASRSAP